MNVEQYFIEHPYAVLCTGRIGARLCRTLGADPGVCNEMRQLHLVAVLLDPDIARVDCWAPLKNDT